MKLLPPPKRAAAVLFFGCLIMNVIACGFGTQTRGLFMGIITKDLGIARSLFSMTFSIVSLLIIPLTANIGLIKDRLRTFRGVIVLGFLLLFAGLVVASFSSSLWGFYLYAFGVQAGTYLCTTPTTTGLINNWFVKNKATLLGLLFAGTSLGGSIGIYLCGVWIDAWGWRTAYLVSALIIAVTGILVVLLVRDHPKDGPVKSDNPSPAPTPARQSRPKSLGNPMWKDKSCLSLGMAILLTSVTTQGLHVCSTMIFQNAGISTVASASIVARALLFATLGKAVSGFLTDRIGVGISRLVLVGVSMIGMTAMLFPSSPLARWGFIIFFGFGAAGGMMYLPMHTSTCFAPEDTLDVFAVAAVFSAVGNFVGAPMISLYFDLFGDYNGIILICVALTALAGFFFSRIRPHAAPCPAPGPDLSHDIPPRTGAPINAVRYGSDGGTRLDR